MAELAEIKAYINSIDLTPVVYRLMKKQKWSKREALRACEQYKNYLYLVKKYSNQYSLPPSTDIDEVWHEHILYTRQYHQDCLRIFGKYLHHSPEPLDNTDNLEKILPEDPFIENTQTLYYKEYGTYIKPITLTFIGRLMENFVKLFRKKASLAPTSIEI